MLPEVLKFIQGTGEKAVNVETLLDHIGTAPTASGNASTHLDQALADGRRLGLVSVQRDLIKPLVPLQEPQESLNFASQLLLLTTQAHGLDNSLAGEATEGRSLRPRRPEVRPPTPASLSRGGYVRSKLDPEPKAGGRRTTVSGIVQATSTTGAKRAAVRRSRSSARKRSRSRRARSGSRSRSRGGRTRRQSSRSRSRSRR